MKILHTSDWHFGRTQGLEKYTECQDYFITQLCKIIDEEHIGAVLCAGDVYDSSVSSAEAIALYNKAATEICMRRDCKLVVIAGNHDGAERLAACNELLEGAGLYVSGRLVRDISPVLLENGTIAVYPIPFFHKDEAAACFPEKKEEIRNQEDAQRVVCEHIRETMDPERFNIIVAHALVSGYETSDSDRAASIGGSTEVPASLFDAFDYTALGHIHKPMKITDKIRYSGSPMKYSFGKEEAQTKGVVVLDTETGEQSFLPLPYLRDMKTIEDTYENLMKLEGEENNYLRLVLTDRYATTTVHAELKEKYPYLLELRDTLSDDEDNGEGSSMTVEQLESMSDTDIMKAFLLKYFNEEPDEEQVWMFETAAEQVIMGGDEQ